MTLRRLPLMAAAALAAVAMSCSSGPKAGDEGDAIASEENYSESLDGICELIRSTPLPATADDSLSYYLGFCEGMTYGERLKQIPQDVSADVKASDYLAGVYSVLAADTLNNSYGDGVLHGVQAARYLSLLERKGVKINRRILASTIVAMLDNPALDSLTRNHADSIAGAIINRQINR